MRSPSLAVVLVALLAATNAFTAPATTAPVRLPQLPVLPEAPPLDMQRVAIGRELFVMSELSRDRKTSCVACHLLPGPGTINTAYGVGVDGKRSTVNPPTVLDAAYNFRQRWTGRDATLEDVIASVLLDPNVIGLDEELVVARVREHDNGALARAMKDAYDGDGDGGGGGGAGGDGGGGDGDGGVTFGNVVDALAAYVRYVVPRDAPFDRWQRGDDDAISADAVEGAQRFVRYGCASCHQGQNIGGNMYAPFGAVAAAFPDGARTDADYGRFNVTKRDEDRYVFRVPSLRNIALTGPYFHDGRADNLDDAIKEMGRLQLGRKLTDADVRLLRAFLESLTGEPRAMPPPPPGHP